MLRIAAGVRESVGLYYPYEINGSHIVWSQQTPLVWIGEWLVVRSREGTA